MAMRLVHIDNTEWYSDEVKERLKGAKIKATYIYMDDEKHFIGSAQANYKLHFIHSQVYEVYEDCEFSDEENDWLYDMLIESDCGEDAVIYLPTCDPIFATSQFLGEMEKDESRKSFFEAWRESVQGNAM